MGYCTQYSLEFSSENQEKHDEFHNFLETKRDSDLGFGSGYLQWMNLVNICFDPDNMESMKWYEHEEDMLELSRMFPEVVFDLYGIGEENADIWHKYFKNGKMQVTEAQITFKPCTL